MSRRHFVCRFREHFSFFFILTKHTHLSNLRLQPQKETRYHASPPLKLPSAVWQSKREGRRYMHTRQHSTRKRPEQTTWSVKNKLCVALTLLFRSSTNRGNGRKSGVQQTAQYSIVVYCLGFRRCRGAGSHGGGDATRLEVMWYDVVVRCCAAAGSLENTN